MHWNSHNDNEVDTVTSSLDDDTTTSPVTSLKEDTSEDSKLSTSNCKKAHVHFIYLFWEEKVYFSKQFDTIHLRQPKMYKHSAKKN